MFKFVLSYTGLVNFRNFHDTIRNPSKKLFKTERYQ